MIRFRHVAIASILALIAAGAQAHGSHAVPVGCSESAHLHFESAVALVLVASMSVAAFIWPRVRAAVGRRQPRSRVALRGDRR